MLLSKVTGATPEKVLSFIADRFDAETARRAAKAYGEEMATSYAKKDGETHDRRQLDQTKLNDEISAARMDQTETERGLQTKVNNEEAEQQQQQVIERQTLEFAL